MEQFNREQALKKKAEIAHRLHEKHFFVEDVNPMEDTFSKELSCGCLLDNKEENIIACLKDDCKALEEYFDDSGNAEKTSQEDAA